MHRIDGLYNVGGFFQDGDPSIGLFGTRVTAAWSNDTQENVIQAILEAGLSLVKGDYDQLKTAIALLADTQVEAANLEDLNDMDANIAAALKDATYPATAANYFFTKNDHENEDHSSIEASTIDWDDLANISANEQASLKNANAPTGANPLATMADVSSPAPADNARIRTGAYTGNGAASRVITTGGSWTPRTVLLGVGNPPAGQVFCLHVDTMGVYSSDGAGNGLNDYVTAQAAGSFTVAANRGNVNTRTYAWTAIG